MDIIVHSLYSKKDVFLRELISNASDALDKLRILSLTDRSLLDAGSDLRVEVSIDSANRLLMIRDTGIGMTRQNLMDNLGTIAKSGTAAFLETYKGAQDSNLIGQFGVGFYSAFLVADYVEVVTKHVNDTQLVWASGADGSFTIAEDSEGPALGRGTLIKLHLREDCPEYLEQDKVKALAAKYSEFINYPIFLETTETREVEREEPSENAAGDAGETTVEDEAAPRTVKATEQVKELKHLNDRKAIWTRNPSDVNESEYVAFYKSVFKREWEEPLAHQHFKGEGDVEFRSVLFIPNAPDPGFYDNYYQKNMNDVKFYVRRVLISDDFELLPKYLSFVKGIVDSDTLPLNIGRETLQHHAALKVIRKKLVRKALDMIRKLAEDKPEDKGAEAGGSVDAKPVESKYDKFYKAFGKSIRMGVIDDTDNRNRLAKLLRFTTSKSEGKSISLETYVSRMKEGQKSIIYLGGSTTEELETSPFLERLRDDGVEVILFTDPLDEYVLTHLSEFDGRKMVDASKEGLDVGDKDRKKKLDAQFSSLTRWWKKVIAAEDDLVEGVKVSSRLSRSPCIVVVSQHGHSANMQRIIKAQAMGSNAEMLKFMGGRRILEINPRHPVVQHVKALLENEGEASEAARTMAVVMYEAAMLESGFELKSAKTFAERIYGLMGKALDMEHTRNAEPVDLHISTDEEEEISGGAGDLEEDEPYADFKPDLEDMHDEL